jgi:hypothetical protein
MPINVTIVPADLCAYLTAHQLTGYITDGVFCSAHFVIDFQMPTKVVLPHAGTYQFIVRWGVFPTEDFHHWNYSITVDEGSQIPLPCDGV